MGALREFGLQWAAAQAPLTSADPCGDRYLVAPHGSGTLVMVVDGVGHGERAATAARCAAEAALQDQSLDAEALVRSCHAALSGNSRGVVLSLGVFEPRLGLMTWLGVGNVEGRLLLRTSGGHYLQQTLLLQPGIVGRRLPRLRPSIMRVSPGDMLIFATDGIAPDFAEALPIGAHVEDIAGGIMARCRKGTDDALVLVVRYLGHADGG